MRRLRRIPLLLVTSAIPIACSPPAGSSGVPSRAGQPGASSGGGGGSGGSISYEISGDYNASGELSFLAQGLTRFENGIWIAYFATGVNATTFFQVNTNPNNPIMNFVNPDISTTSLGTNPR